MYLSTFFSQRKHRITGNLRNDGAAPMPVYHLFFLLAMPLKKKRNTKQKSWRRRVIWCPLPTRRWGRVRAVVLQYPP